MSAQLATASPRRIKASHRRRWKAATGHRPYANDNPYKFTDPDGRQSNPYAKELGQWIRALKDNDWDYEKAKAQIQRQREMDGKMAEKIVDYTALGVVKDAVEVTNKTINGKDATGQGTGAVAGEVAGQVTESALKGKIGDGPASIVGAIVGDAAGSAVESQVNNARRPPASPPPPPHPPPENPKIRDKVGDM